VQRLANQHAQELAMIQQFEQQGILAHENALALKMLLINSMSKPEQMLSGNYSASKASVTTC
jgi:hypothetical protein